MAKSVKSERFKACRLFNRERMIMDGNVALLSHRFLF
jgi:hypothetical protein